MMSLKSHLAGKTHLIWDWNGTLLDDVELAVSLISGLLIEEGLAPISKQDYLREFRFPVKDYYARVGFDFQKTSFETLARRFIDRFHQGVLTCGLHRGARELLSQLKASGYTQSVLSASQESSLRAQLSHHGITELFDHIYGLSDHHAASKVDRGLELIRDSGQDPAQTLLIGDTDHDLEVAKAMGIEALLLGDGHQCHTRLEAIHHRVLRSR